jgi:hypothetical protein
MRRIQKWQQIQLVHMPGAATHSFSPSDDNADAEMAENIPLHLPSSLDSETRARVCVQQVADHERLLCIAQLQDSLVELRHTRKIRRQLMMNHYMQIAGQGTRANTRSRAVLSSIEGRIAKYVERYRIARKALIRLDPTGDWQETYLELKDSDNRGPGKDIEERGVGDGSYFRSWIWLPNPRAPASSDIAAGEEGALDEEGVLQEDVNEAIRVEWTTSYARLERWNEEVELLQEEMRRTVMFLEWKSQSWVAKAEAPRGDSTPDIQSGLNAYASKQAAIYHDLAVSFAKLWRPTLVSYHLQHLWVTKYLTEHGISLTETGPPVLNTRGIFKFRLFDGSSGVTSTAVAVPSAVATASSSLIPAEANHDDPQDGNLEDSSLEDSSQEDSDFDWDDNVDL